MKLDARCVDIFHIEEITSSVLTEIHKSADIFGGGYYICSYDRLVCYLYLICCGKVRGVVDSDHLSASLFYLVYNRGGGGDKVEIKLSLKSLLNYFHVKQSQKSATESKAESYRGFGLEYERGVIQLKLFKRVAQITVFRAVCGINTRIDHRLNCFKSWACLCGWVGVKSDSISYTRFADALDRSCDISYLSRGKLIVFLQSKCGHIAYVNHVKRSSVAHKSYFISALDRAVEYSDVYYNAKIAVVI